MAICRAAGVRLAGLAAAVPERVSDETELAARFGAEMAAKLRDATGIRRRRVAPESLCTSDLCFAAAERLIADLKWERAQIDALVFVSQTPDYILPATSCTLHARLGLAPHCAAFDLNLGCSGYVYGLATLSRLMSAGGIQRALLLVGDTVSRLASPEDRATAPLFGDAGTATALECDPAAPPMVFTLGTDGSGQEHLIVPAGSFRRPRNAATGLRNVSEDGNSRSAEELFMDGANVFSFSLREVPKLIKTTLAAAEWSLDAVDAVVMHQANAFMLRHLAKRLRLPEEKLTLALEDFGNTSSASIPLALVHQCANRLTAGSQRLLLAGFGVGWSWGGAAVTCGPLVVSELMAVPAPASNTAAGNAVGSAA
jgi:3-oxoacyl-[acyl-carrier-protein] synthase-3